jgi:hypothetical protein
MPYRAKVFHIIQDGGTFDQLLELFDKGLASPFSVDPDGETLLHVSDTSFRQFYDQGTCKLTLAK